MGRIFFLNRFYWPETPATGQLLTDLATALANEGESVTVITSRETGSNSVPAELRDGVEIIRVSTPRIAHGTILGKALAFLSFSWGAVTEVRRRLRRGDCIVVMTDPPLLGVPVSWIAQRRGAKLIHWLQDIYPEIAVAVTGQKILRTLTPVRNRAWHRADQCVVLSTEMRTVVAQAGVDPQHATVIPNWAPIGLEPQPTSGSEVRTLRREWGLDGYFVVGYSGNLGRVHDLDPIIEAATKLRDEEQIAFLFVGGGAQRDRLAQRARSLGLTNVRFAPAQPRARLAASLGAADIQLVTLRPGCERFVFPSKFYGITAVGRPVLFVGPRHCELADIITSHGIGRAVDRDKVDEVAATIRELATDSQLLERFRNAALAYHASHNFSTALNQWRNVLKAIGACCAEVTARKTQAPK